LKVDHVTHPAPAQCGTEYYTFFAFMDHVDHGGGPLPGPDKMISSHTIGYNQWSPVQGAAARLVLGAQWWWRGVAHILEIVPAMMNWTGGDPNNGWILVNKNWDGNNTVQYVVLYGPCWGLSVTPGGAAEALSIDWKNILQIVIQKGWFDPFDPTTDPSATQAVYVGVETHEQAVADLWQTDFRIAE
jgi:hypothetical protein